MIVPTSAKLVEPDLALTPKELEEEKFAIEARKKAISELLERECVGQYKIELMFSHKRSCTKPTPGMLSIWESGTQLHGGGDAKIYFCAGKDKGVNNCEAPIPFNNCNYGHLLCPKCGKVWSSLDVKGELIGNWTMQTWATKLVHYYTFLGHNADLYLKQPREDIRKAARLEQEKVYRGEKLDTVRTGLIRVIYPLVRIVKDTNNGANLYDRFYAFLKS